MQKTDRLDTMTNIILNNEYKLHDNKEKDEEIKQKSNFNVNAKTVNTKMKKTLKKKIFLIIKILVALIIMGIIFIFLFFKTSLFQKYKEIWVETAMSTMNHQYLATWFLSDEEIQEILKRLEVVNNEDSNLDDIVIKKPNKKNEITVEKITGKNYVGYVMIVPDASKLKLVDSRKSNRGTKLSEIVQNNNAIAVINAGGFTDENGVGMGHQLCKTTIIDKKLTH